MGNSGTSTRILMGLIASHPVTATFVGDASLSKRPMGRVIEPLSQMGASFEASEGAKGSQTLPLILKGASPAVPISYRLPVASAQVKSAIRQIGRASCRERECQYVYLSVVAVSLKKKRYKLTL